MAKLFYDGQEHALWVNFDEDIDDPTSINGDIQIPILNNPYNLLVYREGKAELWAIDYNLNQVYLSTPCVLSPNEHENILRLYYPL